MNIKNEIKNILTKMIKVSDQLLITLWSFALTFIFSNYGNDKDLLVYSIYYTIQSITLLLLNSSIGQQLLLEGGKFTFRSIIKYVLGISVISFFLIFFLIFFEFVRVDSSLLTIVLFSISVSLFNIYELFRRYGYSLGVNKKLASFTSLFVFLNSGVVCSLIYFNYFNFENYLWSNIFIYAIVIVLLITYLKDNVYTLNQEGITLIEIVNFNKWLLPGTIAYTISNHFFILYLNNIGNRSEVVQLRLLETIFGVVFVFISAFENLFISTIKSNKFIVVFKEISRIWSLFIFGVIFVAFLVNYMLVFLFNQKESIPINLLILITLYYVLLILSRIFVVYLRVNKLNNIIFLGNIVNSLIVISIVFLKVDLSLQLLFLIKTLFIIINILIYSLPLFKYGKEKYLNFSRFWSR